MGAIREDGYTGELVGRAGDVRARFERLPYKIKDGKPRNKLPEEPRPHSFDLRLDMRDLEPINLTVDLPSVRCAVCGIEHRTGERDVESDLSDAMIAAFGSGGLTY